MENASVQHGRSVGQRLIEARGLQFCFYLRAYSPGPQIRSEQLLPSSSPMLRKIGAYILSEKSRRYTSSRFSLLRCHAFVSDQRILPIRIALHKKNLDQTGIWSFIREKRL